jgi:hypothetical protein
MERRESKVVRERERNLTLRVLDDALHYALFDAARHGLVPSYRSPGLSPQPLKKIQNPHYATVHT